MKYNHFIGGYQYEEDNHTGWLDDAAVGVIGCRKDLTSNMNISNTVQSKISIRSKMSYY